MHQGRWRPETIQRDKGKVAVQVVKQTEGRTRENTEGQAAMQIERRTGGGSRHYGGKKERRHYKWRGRQRGSPETIQNLSFLEGAQEVQKSIINSP